MASDKPDSFGVGAFEVVPKADVRTFVEKLNRLREAVDQCRLQDGVGYTVQRSSGGTTLAIRPQAASAEAAKTHPWKVTLGRENENYFFTVEPASDINTGEYIPDNLTEKIALNTSKLEADYLALVHFKVDGELRPSGFTLKAVKKSQFEGNVVPPNGEQTEGNCVLATITKSGRVVQSVFGHLFVTIINYGGFAALVLLQLYSGGFDEQPAPPE